MILNFIPGYECNRIRRSRPTPAQIVPAEDRDESQDDHDATRKFFAACRPHEQCRRDQQAIGDPGPPPPSPCEERIAYGDHGEGIAKHEVLTQYHKWMPSSKSKRCAEQARRNPDVRHQRQCESNNSRLAVHGVIFSPNYDLFYHSLAAGTTGKASAQRRFRDGGYRWRTLDWIAAPAVQTLVFDHLSPFPVR